MDEDVPRRLHHNERSGPFKVQPVQRSNAANCVSQLETMAHGYYHSMGKTLQSLIQCVTGSVESIVTLSVGCQGLSDSTFCSRSPASS